MPALCANLRNSVKKALIVAACALLASCGSIGDGLSDSAVNPVNWLTPYRADVIQGNFVSAEQIAQLQPGMTRDQVKSVLGTPLLASVFHADRWDYVFTLKRQGVEPRSFKYTVFFKGDQLERFEGDTMPSENEFIATLSNRRTLGKVPVLEASEAQLKAAQRPSAAKSAQELARDAAIAPAGPLPAYPPLEGGSR